MQTDFEEQQTRPPLMKRALALLVLVLAVALGIYILIGIIKAVFWTAVVLVAAVAVLWALKTLVW